MLETIYAVMQTTQDSDGDGWWYGKASEIVSYHRTNDGAILKIKELIAEEITLIQEWTADNEEEKDNNLAHLNLVINNLTQISIGCGKYEIQEHPLYYVEPIQVYN